MIRLDRPALSSNAQAFLAKRTRRVAGAPDLTAEVEKLWSGSYLDNATFAEIRRRLAEEMASGLMRCMYCEDSRGTDIEHFRPKNIHPLRAFCWHNYLWACSHCNSNQKRTQFPLDELGQPLLLDPTIDDPAAHLLLTPSTGAYHPLTRRAEESVRVFGLNREELEIGRADAWEGAQALIEKWARNWHDPTACLKLQGALCRHPFTAVIHTLVTLARNRPDSDLITPDCRRALRDHPEILDCLVPAP